MKKWKAESEKQKPKLKNSRPRTRNSSIGSMRWNKSFPNKNQTERNTMIPKPIVKVLALLALFTLNLQLSTCFAQGTAFTYQGRLDSSGSPASGRYDIAFSLYPASAGGVALAGPVTKD